MVVEVYGQPMANDEYDEIKLTSEFIKTVSPSGEMEVTVDETKPVGYEEVVVSRRDGAVYQSYKHYYKDGELVKTEDLATSNYRAYAGEMIVGPEAPTDAVDPETTTPDTTTPEPAPVPVPAT